jgi:crossover junction endodeoxyribonuclease RuvC
MSSSKNADSEPGRVPENCPWPIVLGLDPGTRVLGYGAILDARGDHRLLAAGAIRPAGDEAPARLGDIQRQIMDLFERLRPTVIVVETAFSTLNVQSALRLGEARGVLLACASRWGAEVVQYAPSVPRKTLLGNGNAKKEQVAAMVATLLGLAEPPRPLDVTDALSLALTYLHRGKTLERLTRGTSKSRLQP